MSAGAEADGTVGPADAVLVGGRDAEIVDRVDAPAETEAVVDDEDVPAEAGEPGPAEQAATVTVTVAVRVAPARRARGSDERRTA